MSNKSLKELEIKSVRNQNVFFQVNGKLWRIGNKLYDLTPFLDSHPGGRKVLEL
jgi:cytochrome b involved in lipid metabolism